MNHLIVQHPALAKPAITAFSNLLGVKPQILEPSLAVWSTPTAVTKEQIAQIASVNEVDASLWVGQPGLPALSDYRLIAFDMDSTVITIECIDEIADYAHCKAEVAAITAAAMRGEIADYAESLRQRVALLAGLPEKVLDDVYEDRLRLTPGVQTLIAGAKEAGLHTLLVSGGFTFFTEKLRKRLGFNRARSNNLEIIDGRLTGGMLGAIVGPDTKRNIVTAFCAELGCPTSQAIVVGDGANDLPMMSIAGASIAFRAKPVVQCAATHAINHCGLDAALNFFAR